MVNKLTINSNLQIADMHIYTTKFTEQSVNMQRTNSNMKRLIILTAITVTVHGENCASILNFNDDDSQYDKLKCTVCTSLGQFTSMSAKLTNLTNELVTIADNQKFMLSSNVRDVVHI